MSDTRTNLTLVIVVLAALSFANLRDCNGQERTPTLQPFNDADLSPQWNVVAGDWKVQDGVLVVDSMAVDSYVTFGEPTWQNYEVSANITFRKVKNSSRWLSILVRASRDGITPWSQVPVRFNTKASNGMEFAVRTLDNAWSIRSKAGASAASALNVPRQLKVIVRGSLVDAYLDGELVVSSRLCVDRPNGCVGLGASGCIATFDDFSVRHLPATPSNQSDVTSECDIVAHRGFSAIAPENTLAAIRAAVKAGATGCEFDVYGCKDGTVVLMHDKSVDRTTNGKGNVTELSLQALRKLDAGSWKHAKYQGEKVPTLTEALTLLKDTQCQPVIEIKMEGISKQVVDDVRALGMVDQVAVIAFSDKVVSEIRSLEPRITCAWLYGKEIEGSPAQQADWLKTKAAQCNANVVDLKYTILSPMLINELKRRELGVWTWTVNEPVVMRSLKRWGIDSITTDHPDRLRHLDE